MYEREFRASFRLGAEQKTFEHLPEHFRLILEWADVIGIDEAVRMRLDFFEQIQFESRLQPDFIYILLSPTAGIKFVSGRLVKDTIDYMCRMRARFKEEGSELVGHEFVFHGSDGQPTSVRDVKDAIRDVSKRKARTRRVSLGQPERVHVTNAVFKERKGRTRVRVVAALGFLAKIGRQLADLRIRIV
jgi:hypothetical protein